MANLANPVDEGLIDLGSVRRKLVAAFMEDRRLSAVEAAVLDAFDAAVAPIRDYRAKERAADYWLHGGDIESRYGQRHFAAAGVTITPLEEVSMAQPARVVRLSDHRHDPNEAA